MNCLINSISNGKEFYLGGCDSYYMMNYFCNVYKIKIATLFLILVSNITMIVFGFENQVFFGKSSHILVCEKENN